jgi:hypothetical protein
MLEFLREIDVTLYLPEQPLTDFVLLGSLMTHYGFLSKSEPATAKQTLELFELLREKHELPPGPTTRLSSPQR